MGWRRSERQWAPDRWRHGERGGCATVRRSERQRRRRRAKGCVSIWWYVKRGARTAVPSGARRVAHAKWAETDRQTGRQARAGKQTNRQTTRTTD